MLGVSDFSQREKREITEGFRHQSEQQICIKTLFWLPMKNELIWSQLDIYEAHKQALQQEMVTAWTRAALYNMVDTSYMWLLST